MNKHITINQMCIVFGLWEETRHTWDHKERPCNEVIEHPQRNNQKLIANIYLIICNMLQLKMVFMHAAILAWIFLNIFFIYITGYPGLILSESYVWLQQSNSHISEREWWWQAKEKKQRKETFVVKQQNTFFQVKRSEHFWRCRPMTKQPNGPRISCDAVLNWLTNSGSRN